MPQSSDFGTLLSQVIQPTRRKVFVSYHHGGDQGYYNAFTGLFSSTYDVVYDNSLERRVDSEDTRYVIQRIRDTCVTGSSCTIVLCGAETPWRKYVDWEIKATLDKQHGLIGVNLPSNPRASTGNFVVPDRLHDNIESGFAIWTTWAEFTANAEAVRQTIEIAISRPASRINNSREMRSRNGTPPIR